MDGGGRFDGTLAPSPSAAGAARALALPFLRLRLPLARRSSVAVPFGRRLPRFLGTALTVGFFAVTGFAGAVSGGHLDGFEAAYGAPHHAGARLAGFGVDRVTIAGLSQLDERAVLEAAGLNALVSLPFLDAAATRSRIEDVPLVKSASVRKLYPNEIVLTLVERVPHALWQLNGELSIAASDGTVLDDFSDPSHAHLPLVVGEQANLRTREYLALLDAAGPLRPRIKAGTLVSGRRWTLKVDGIDVRLPELGAAEAVARLVRLEREQKILGKDVLAIDLRMSDRIVVRLSEEAAAVRAEALKKKPTRGKGVET